MKPSNVKWVQVLAPAAAVNNASASPAVIDTRGYSYLELIVELGATDTALTALEIQESDTNTANTFVPVTGLIYGTSQTLAVNSAVTAWGVTQLQLANSSLPTANSGDSQWLFNVDLKGRKRYIQPVLTAGTGTNGAYLAAIGRLSNDEVAPSTPAGYGVTQVLQCPAYGT
jgi:hypothetical protein